jgi:hypothetical protein
MHGMSELARFGRVLARGGLCVSLVIAVACGDDDGSDPTGSSSGGNTSTGPVGSSSSSEVSSGSESSTAGTTAAVDDTSTSTSTSGSSEETAIPEVFFPEVLAIIQAECFCHISPMPSGMLDLRDDMAYASLVDTPSVQVPAVARVTPGDPDNSYLYLKLLGEQASVGGGGTRMPQGGTMLPDQQLDLVRYWILGGAQP